MKKLLRSLFRISVFILLLVTGVFIINTITFTSKQVKTQKTNPLVLDTNLIVQKLSKAIQYPTISLPGSIDTAAFVGFDTFIVESFPFVDSLLEFRKINEFSRVYKWAGKNGRLPPILLTGHTDVVPVDNASLSEWQVPPFSGKITDGYIWGRGALDDKLSVIGILESVEKLLKEGYTPERTVYLAFGHDEEVGGSYGAQQIADYFDQNNIQFEYVLDEGMIIIEDALEGMDRPIAIIGVAEKGYVTLTITARLKDAGHSSLPPPESAIGLLSKAITRLETNPFPADIDGVLASFFDYVGPEMPGLNKAVFANRWFTKRLIINQMSGAAGTNASIRTTIAPTMLRAGFKENVLPSMASAKVNFRIKPGETTASVLEYVRKTINDDRIIIAVSKEVSVADPSPISETASFGFEIIQRSIQEVFPDVIIAPGLVVGATDGKYYEKVSNDVYRFLPVKLKNEDLKRIHGINEKMSTSAYLQLVHFYYQLIKNSCQ